MLHLSSRIQTIVKSHFATSNRNCDKANKSDKVIWKLVEHTYLQAEFLQPLRIHTLYIYSSSRKS